MDREARGGTAQEAQTARGGRRDLPKAPSYWQVRHGAIRSIGLAGVAAAPVAYSNIV